MRLLPSGAMRPALLLALSALSLLATACEDRARNEAKLFLSKVADVDENAPVDRRRAEIDALRDLVVTTEEIRTAQRTCVRAHEALLHAEEEQQHAQRALEQAAEHAGRAAPLSAADQTAIQRSIDASNTAIAAARESFPTCQHEVEALKHRYGEGGP